MKTKQLSNFHKLLNDEEFWRIFSYISLKSCRVKRFREYRTKLFFPKAPMMKKWINEDYRLIRPNDTRTDEEIMLWLVSDAS